MKRIYGLTFLILLLLLTGCGKSIEAKWQEQYDLGMQYLSSGDYEAAIVAFSKAIELEPQTWTAYEGMISVYEAQGNYAQAVSVIGQGIEAAGYESIENDTRSWIVEKYISWAEMYDENGDYEEAIRILEEGYQYTDDENILKRLAYIQIGNELVVWDDAILENMVREKLGLEGDVYAKELDGVTSLVILGNTYIGVNGEMDGTWAFRYLEGEGATSTDGSWVRTLFAYYGVEGTSGDDQLYTERGDIRSIEVLKYFRNLESVTIIANHVEEISVISEMNLTDALFFANDIADLSPLDSTGWDPNCNEQFVEIGDLLIDY